MDHALSLSQDWMNGVVPFGGPIVTDHPGEDDDYTQNPAKRLGGQPTPVGVVSVDGGRLDENLL